MLKIFLAMILVTLPVSLSAGQAADLVQAGDLINGSYLQRPLKETGRYWDLAITGSGYFPLKDYETGESLYTRMGRFELSQDGHVVLSGHPTLRLLVQLDSRIGPLNMLDALYLDGAPMVGISTDEKDQPGVVEGVYSNGEIRKVARLILAKFFNDGALVATMPNVFRAENAALPSLLAPPEEKGLGAIRRGSLEQF